MAQKARPTTSRRGRRPARRTARSASHGSSVLLRDAIAIACIAVAIYLAFVLYFGWAGGAVGAGLVTGLETIVGLLTYAAPLLLIFVAVLVVAGAGHKPLPLASVGLVLVCLAVLLAAAADSFGIFPGTRPKTLWAAAYMQEHGGAIGESMWAGTRFLLGRVGTAILVVALAVGGLLLISGTSLGLWARRSRQGMVAARDVASRTVTTIGERSRAADERLAATVAARQEALAARETAERTSLFRRPAPPLVDQEAETVGNQFGPAVSVHMPKLVDAARDVPELYVGGEHERPVREAPPAPPLPAPVPVAPAKPTQLSLSAEAVDEESLSALTAGSTRSWSLPDPSLLRRLTSGHGEQPHTIAEVSRRLVETLESFNVQAQVVDHVSGPRVTRYELQLAPGTKVSRVSSLKADLAYSLAATEIRVQAPIPGKSAVGVEVPNVEPTFIGLGDVYGNFPSTASPLAFWLGKDITGKAVLADLARLIHLLVAGTTGSGKSACINCFISGLLLRSTPDQVRLILIDPKQVELSHFDGVPHLLTPVVTDMRKAGYVLANVVHEMERRYKLMSETDNSQNLKDLNRKLEKAGEQPLPYIVLVIDELADLMMVAPNDVESAITRLGQLGRGAGVHMVVATQRPSVDVITGLIKSNIPSRIAFAVSSQTDSRVILDIGGAESLLGEGDMLFSPHGSSRMLRVQGAFTSSEEMKLITAHWRTQADPEFRKDLLETPVEAGGSGGEGGAEDELLADAITTVVTNGAASVALLQRRLRVGYARAGRLIDIMEQRGIISGYDGSKARNVLIRDEDLARVLGELNGTDAVSEDDDLTEQDEDIALAACAESAGDEPC